MWFSQSQEREQSAKKTTKQTKKTPSNYDMGIKYGKEFYKEDF